VDTVRPDPVVVVAVDMAAQAEQEHPDRDRPEVLDIMVAEEEAAAVM
jgi:hypothetical protein